ncbi:hypothetical protein CK203_091515 [Vitis vinifera]|uniref:Uncharacterized protein n=1 Tax=Vitis vinifera TaxID=29760 RepID=A0A438CK36_VITVI|nr:hypothetical protein CK203_091515 [Vitis vinifera]
MQSRVLFYLFLLSWDLSFFGCFRFNLLFFLLIEHRYSWCSVCWESWLMSICRGSSRQALVGIHVFAGIGFCGLPLAFDVGWAGIFMVVALVGQYDMGMLLPFSVLGRQLVACVSSAL